MAQSYLNQGFIDPSETRASIDYQPLGRSGMTVIKHLDFQALVEWLHVQVQAREWPQLLCHARFSGRGDGRIVQLDVASKGQDILHDLNPFEVRTVEHGLDMLRAYDYAVSKGVVPTDTVISVWPDGWVAVMHHDDEHPRLPEWAFEQSGKAD